MQQFMKLDIVQVNQDSRQTQESITVLGTKFKTSVSEELVEIFKQFGEQQKWSLDEQQYQSMNASQVFLQMLETDVKQLHIGDNNNPTIIADIADINFVNLKILGLSQNRISNIQLLSRMMLPSLVGLNLFDNCITSIRPLRRMILCPNLFVLSLNDNFITDLSAIADMPYQEIIRQIGINYMQFTLCCDSLGWFIKMKNPNFSQLLQGLDNIIELKSVRLYRSVKKNFKLPKLQFYQQIDNFDNLNQFQNECINIYFHKFDIKIIIKNRRFNNKDLQLLLDRESEEKRNMMDDFMFSLLQQQHQSICSPGSQQHAWCPFEAVDYGTIFVENIYMGFIFLLALVIVRNYVKLLKYRANKVYKHLFGDAYIWIYRVVFLWLFCVMSRAILSIVVYYTLMQQKSPDDIYDPDIKSPIVTAANIFNILFFVSAFFANFLIMLVPFHWLNVVLLWINENQQLPEKFINKITRWLKILRALRIYFKYVRTSILLIVILQPLLFYLTTFARCSMRYFNFYFLLLQSMMALVFFIFSFYISYIVQKKKLLRFQFSDAAKITCQFLLFFCSFIIRITFVIYALFFRYTLYKPNWHCLDEDPTNDVQLALMLSLQHCMLHLFPLSCIVYMYRPTLSGRQEQENLLDSFSEGSVIQPKRDFKNIKIQFFRRSFTEQPNLNKSKQQVTNQDMYFT